MSHHGGSGKAPSGRKALARSLKSELGDFRGLTESLRTELGEFFEKDRGWKLLALALVGILMVVFAVQLGIFGKGWQAECESSWGSYFEERYYSEGEIADLVDGCVQIAEDWEADGTPETTIRGSLINEPELAEALLGD
jgi:hypothetical protein